MQFVAETSTLKHREHFLIHTWMLPSLQSNPVYSTIENISVTLLQKMSAFFLLLITILMMWMLLSLCASKYVLIAVSIVDAQTLLGHP